MTGSGEEQRCLMCGAGVADTPLVRIEYRDSAFRVCPQHLPVLIHDPAQLVGKLPGAERLKPADHHD
jgi:hypothetical protein